LTSKKPRERSDMTILSRGDINVSFRLRFHSRPPASSSSVDDEDDEADDDEDVVVVVFSFLGSSEALALVAVSSLCLFLVRSFFSCR
jgi:hypothetical protein